MSEFFLIKTDMTRTRSGLLLPNKPGRAVAVIGTLATEWFRQKTDNTDIEIQSHQACVIVETSLFLRAATDMLESRRAPEAQ